MNVLLQAFFILLSLGQLTRLELFSSVAILGYEFIMLLIVLLAFITKWNIIKSVVQKTQVKAFVFFLGILSLSLLASLPRYIMHENIEAFAYLVRLILYALFFMTLFSFKTIALEKGLKILTILTILFSFAQYIFIPNLQFLESRGWDPHVGRVVGMFLDPTAAGTIFVLLFFYFLVQQVTCKQWYGKMSVSVVMLSSLFFLILLTYSRVTYIGFVSGLLYLLYRQYRPRLVLSVLIIFFICIPLLPRVSGESTNLQRTYSISTRLTDIKKGIVLWQQHPMLGIGYNHIPALKNVNSASNHSDSAFSSSFVTIMATSGLLGLGACIYLFLQIFRKGTLLTQNVTIIIVLTSFIENVFLLNVVLAVFLVLVAFKDNR